MPMRKPNAPRLPIYHFIFSVLSTPCVVLPNWHRLKHLHVGHPRIGNIVGRSCIYSGYHCLGNEPGDSTA